MYVIIIKDCIKTRFTQDADLFEPFKFVGVITEVEGIPKETPEATLRALAKQNNKMFEIVAAIIPNVGTAVIENHRVCSDGEHWFMVEEASEAYGASLTTTVSLTGASNGKEVEREEGKASD